MLIEAFAEEVDNFFRENYGAGSEERYFSEHSDRPTYSQRGEPYTDILSYELECDEATVEAISNALPDATWHDIAQGAELFYDTTLLYERISAVAQRDHEEEEAYWYENRFSFQWQDFCETVQYGRRFFRIKEQLDKLFGNPGEYENGAINPLRVLQIGHRIYRARILDAGVTSEQIDKNPSQELDAPPRNKTRAGRMNVDYIPVFYGAFTEKTAIAETRPGIDEKIAIGEFSVQRELKVFDFTAFSLASPEQSDMKLAHTRYEFIDQMEREISRPVQPYDKMREYIPTQMVAEYLKEYFGCEAIIYRSSMIKGNSQDNRNIAILNNGNNFLDGENPALNFEKHQIKIVENVAYDVVAPLF